MIRTSSEPYNEKFEPVKIKGDGACFWRAVAYQVLGDQDRFREIKNAVIRQAKAKSNALFKFYKTPEYVDTEDFNASLKTRLQRVKDSEDFVKAYIDNHVAPSDVWGGNVLDRLLIASAYKRDLQIVQKGKNGYIYDGVLPPNILNEANLEPIQILYNGRNHYSGIKKRGSQPDKNRRRLSDAKLTPKLQLEGTQLSDGDLADELQLAEALRLSLESS